MLLRALSVCHKHWVLHRDVKPNNCLLATTGELKLGDFGLSRLTGSQSDRRHTPQVLACRSWRGPGRGGGGAAAMTLANRRGLGTSLRDRQGSQTWACS